MRPGLYFGLGRQLLSLACPLKMPLTISLTPLQNPKYGLRLEYLPGTWPYAPGLED